MHAQEETPADIRRRLRAAKRSHRETHRELRSLMLNQRDSILFPLDSEGLYDLARTCNGYRELVLLLERKLHDAVTQDRW